MKNIFIAKRVKMLVMLLILAMWGQKAYMQNVGINTPDPRAKLQVTGSFMVSSPYIGSAAEPTGAEQKNMINNQPIYFENDSVARFYDPGGSNGNYLPNMNGLVRCTTYVGNYVDAYLEITIESLQLGTGDTLTISDEQNGGPFYKIGNATIGLPIVLNTTSAQVTFNFKSNADASVGSGFSVKVKTMYPYTGYDYHLNRSGYGMAYHTTEKAIRLGSLDQKFRGNKSIVMGAGSSASGTQAVAVGAGSRAAGSSSVAMGGAATGSYETIAIGNGANADAPYAIALGNYTEATGFNAIALGGSSATGSDAVSIGVAARAEGEHTTAIGYGTKAKSYSSIAVGSYNMSYAFENANSWVAPDPLFVIGNGTNNSSRSNALIVLKNGKMGLGTDFPATSLHIKQGSGGGLMLENGADFNKWRIYSASGDNNLTFYNNANVEVADIDDVTGTFSAISDERHKKDISPLGNVLALVKQLSPTTYHFNWQQTAEEKQIGMLAQQTYKLFPELVSYDKEKDLYKMNYAGFSTVAIAAIQEQQVIIGELHLEMKELKRRMIALEAKLNR